MTKLFTKAHVDIVFGLIIIAVAAVVYVTASALPRPRYDPVGPGGIPMGVAIALGGLGAIVLVGALRGAWRGAEETDGAVYRRRPAMALTVFALTVAYTLAMTAKPIGFIESTIGFIVLSVVAIAGPSTRVVVAAGVVGSVLGVGGYLLFTRVFLVELP